MSPLASDALEQHKIKPKKPEQHISQQLSNSWRKGTIEAAFLLNKNLESRSLEVYVIGDSVTLQGSLSSEIKKSLAEEIAMSVHGIEKVANHIAVVADTHQNIENTGAIHPSKKDKLLSAKVQKKLRTNKHFQSAFIQVYAKNGVVELSGKTPEEPLKDLAYYLVKNITGVKSIKNQITTIP